MYTLPRPERHTVSYPHDLMVTGARATLGQAKLRELGGLKSGYVWFMSNQLISSLRPLFQGLGCTPGGQGHASKNDTEEMEPESARRPAELKARALLAEVWNFTPVPLSLLPPLPCFPNPCPSGTNKLWFPEPMWSEWMRSLVMLWVNNLVRKLKIIYWLRPWVDVSLLLSRGLSNTANVRTISRKWRQWCKKHFWFH